MGKNKPLFEEILQKTAACFVILGKKLLGNCIKERGRTFMRFDCICGRFYAKKNGGFHVIVR